MSVHAGRVLIVGGGLAGPAAAIVLARAGVDVLLVEREKEAVHKVCGEFLSAEALESLHTVGLDAAALGAVSISRVRIDRGGETRLPFAAMSMTRRALDEALLAAAERAGASVQRGCRVLGIEQAGDGWAASIENGAAISARNVFLATGKHDLRGRPRPAGKQANLVGFKMYWELAPAQTQALDGCVELMLYPGGYAGLQMVEDGAANLCCLIERAELQRLGGNWEKLLAHMQAGSPLLRGRLRGARPLLARPLAVASIPYGYVRPASDGLWALGDQAAVIPSFTGDGMSIALHSGLTAASMYLAGADAAAFQARMSGDLRAQVRFATMLSQGLVRPSTQALAQAATALFPGILRYVARRTRVAS